MSASTTTEERSALADTLSKMRAARDKIIMGGAVQQVRYETWGHTYHAPDLPALTLRIREIEGKLGIASRRSVGVRF